MQTATSRPMWLTPKRYRAAARSTARACVALALFGASACAVASTLKFVGWNVPGAHPSVSIAQPSSTSATAGEFSILLDGNHETSFCIEPYQYIQFGQVYTDYTLVDGATRFGATALGRLAGLYENHLDEARTSGAASAAFQIAVWEIVFEAANPIRLNEGTFSIGGPFGFGKAGTLAADWLAALDSQPQGNWRFAVLQSERRQDQLIASEIPLPATAALLGVGLLGLAGARRRAR